MYDEKKLKRHMFKFMGLNAIFLDSVFDEYNVQSSLNPDLPQFKATEYFDGHSPYSKYEKLRFINGLFVKTNKPFLHFSSSKNNEHQIFLRPTSVSSAKVNKERLSSYNIVYTFAYVIEKDRSATYFLYNDLTFDVCMLDNFSDSERLPDYIKEVVSILVSDLLSGSEKTS
jgi:hypothetical protein